MPRKKKEVIEEVSPKKKGKKKKEEKISTKAQDYFCVIDKQYTNTKKNDPPIRFVYIKMEERIGKPENERKVLDHATIHYSWFNDPEEARNFKKELLQENV